jgi:hypothetical protein
VELHRDVLTSRYKHVESEHEKENTEDPAKDVLREAPTPNPVTAAMPPDSTATAVRKIRKSIWESG